MAEWTKDQGHHGDHSVECHQDHHHSTFPIGSEHEEDNDNEGTDEQKRRAFADTFMVLRRRIELFASLPFAKLDRLALQRSVTEIGKK